MDYTTHKYFQLKLVISEITNKLYNLIILVGIKQDIFLITGSKINLIIGDYTPIFLGSLYMYYRRISGFPVSQTWVTE